MKLDQNKLNQWKSMDKKASYVCRSWKTSQDDTMSWREYAELVNPAYKYISGNPKIIAKQRKDGGYFLKMLIPLTGTDAAEFPLAFENDFEEGDVINLDTLTFCTEKWMDQVHLYATGEVI